jgi:hypothetical protein
LNRLSDHGNSCPGDIPSWKRHMIETKLKISNVNVFVAIFAPGGYPDSYWENQGYNWFSGS